MLIIDELRKLNNSNADLDELMEITTKADLIDTYLIKLIHRFKEKINFEDYYLS